MVHPSATERDAGYALALSMAHLGNANGFTRALQHSTSECKVQSSVDGWGWNGFLWRGLKGRHTGMHLPLTAGDCGAHPMASTAPQAKRSLLPLRRAAKADENFESNQALRHATSG